MHVRKKIACSKNNRMLTLTIDVKMQTTTCNFFRTCEFFPNMFEKNHMLGKKSHVDMKFLNVNVNMRFSHVNMREKSHVNMQHLFLTTVRSYSAQTRSQNEEKNPPPKPYLPLQTRTGHRRSHKPHPMCKVDEHQR